VGRLLVLDGLLTLWVTLAQFAAFEAVRGKRLRRGWWLLAAVACGLGILTKGPVGLLLLVPPLWAYRWLGSPCFRLRGKDGLAFAGIVLTIALPWYVAICLRAPEFAAYFLWEHNVVRFLAPFDHLRPVWFYAPILLGGLLPGTLLAVPFIRFLFSGHPETAQRRCPELGFALLAGGWCVLFFSLSGCKLPTYILPAFPFFALAMGVILVHTGWQKSRLWHAALAGSLVLLLLGHHVVLPWYAEFRSPFSRPDEVARLAGNSSVPVVCYPRNCDSLAFYLGRDDFLNYRSKETPALIEFMKQHPATVVLFTHRHSLGSLRQVLPPTELTMTDITPLYDSARAGVEGWKYLLAKSPLGDGSRDRKENLCYLAVVRKVRSDAPAPRRQ
jgi:hypothetical protein